MGSERLPGKIVAPIAGRPMIEHVIERTALARSIDAIVVATSDQAADDSVPACVMHEAARQAKPVRVVRGPERDVLHRFTLAADGAARIVRITGDCPLIDWSTIDALVERFDQNDLDYAGAGPASGFPRGLDCEIMRTDILARAARDATDPADREHVTRYIYTHPDTFRCATLPASAARRRGYRLCVDEPDDLALVRALYDRLWQGTPIAIDEVIALLDREPTLADLNRAVQQRAH